MFSHRDGPCHPSISRLFQYLLLCQAVFILVKSPASAFGNSDQSMGMEVFKANVSPCCSRAYAQICSPRKMEEDCQSCDSCPLKCQRGRILKQRRPTSVTVSEGHSRHISHRLRNIKVGHWKTPILESGALIFKTVSQDGSTQFKSIQQAVDSVPSRNTQRIIIQIEAGTYRERVVVPYNKPFITFRGSENGTSLITWNATANSDAYKSKWSRMNVTLFGTMQSASVTILSDGFVAENMGFENSAPAPAPGAVGAQAVAFLIAGDRAAFYHCTFLGAQDTLYDYHGRHFYMNCHIQGSIDFIFGNGRSLFEGCVLHSIATSFGAIAAHQRLSPDDDTGFSFHRCTVTGSGSLYLGRAWSAYARIVFSQTYLSNIIFAPGWSDFGDPRRQSTTFFGQYQCTGPGADPSHRANWTRELSEDDVRPFLGLGFVNGEEWIRDTPFT